MGSINLIRLGGGCCLNFISFLKTLILHLKHSFLLSAYKGVAMISRPRHIDFGEGLIDSSHANRGRNDRAKNDYRVDQNLGGYLNLLCGGRST